MSTPEGKVKARIDRTLAKYADEMYVLKPVSNGMGAPTLDYLGWYRGQPFGIEAKAGTGVMTPRQALTASRMQAGGGKAFLVNEVIGLDELDAWLRSIGC